ncbi:regulatory signaling modulator protein AmpE [Thiohalobacter thiocyanaticus]|uniref:AmpE protein n=1 Tax=Thiohalobacter thiocyanaticus TaxID=585455 RepID=A0A426QI24_9GAMM|nr:regulatory signaling modulator protein AmpE [Thiohalobacter thiocyanaticus]RRQ21400.1 hypothetical protein D6C00_05220 [Thiohalobacter thiocyanaticus]
MKFLVILLALGLERLYPELQRWRPVDRFHDYTDAFRSRFTQPWLLGRGGLIALLAPWLLALWLLLELLEPLDWLIALAVLLLCLGPRDLAGDLRRLRADLGVGTPGAETLAAFGLGPAAVAGDTLAAALIRTALVRLFGVMFWFALLGPVGALLYRLTQLLAARADGEEDDFSLAVWQLQALLDWLPARALAATGALIGSFDATLAAWRECAPADPFDDSREFAAEVALESMELEPGAEPAAALERARDYLLRAGLAWLALLALLTLAGWLA